MKRQILWLFAVPCLFLTSCSQDDFVEEAKASNLEEVIENYEASLKGYDKYAPDPSVKTETPASAEYMQSIMDSVETMFSKTKVNTRYMPHKGGIFKYNTCGDYAEFHYIQDNENSSGHTHKAGDVGETFVDASKDLNLRMCVVPLLNPYGGGLLLLDDYLPSEMIKTNTVVIQRRHDDEDSNNHSKVTRSGSIPGNGMAIGNGTFGGGGNTLFTWVFLEGNKKASYIPFKYGVIAHDDKTSDGVIYIDDEDSGNSNWARIHVHHVSEGKYATWDFNNQARLHGVKADKNTEYHLKVWN